jgi:TonB family protein
VNFGRFRAMFAATRSPLRLLLALLLTLAAVPGAHSQDHPAVGDLASQIAVAMEQLSVKSVVVFEFTGPDTYVTPVGGMLADDLSDVLARSSSKFKVIDRIRAVKALESNRLAPEITADQEVAAWIAQGIGADVALVGRLSSEGGNILLTIDCLLAKEGKSLKSFQSTFPLTDKWKADLAINIDPDSAVSATLGNQKNQGTSFAQCTSCPPPQFPPAARKLSTHRTVILEVVIGTDGKARDIRVLKTEDQGFSVAAIQAIQKWRFKPARSTKGAPMETRAPIELNFS